MKCQLSDEFSNPLETKDLKFLIPCVILTIVLLIRNARLCSIHDENINMKTLKYYLRRTDKSSTTRCLVYILRGYRFVSTSSFSTFTAQVWPLLYRGELSIFIGVCFERCTRQSLYTAQRYNLVHDAHKSSTHARDQMASIFRSRFGVVNYITYILHVVANRTSSRKLAPFTRGLFLKTPTRGILRKIRFSVF